jgi:DNA-binding MarR family transcriptional regulator
LTILPEEEAGEVRRSERKLKTPDLGILAVRLLLDVQSELFRRVAQHSFDDLRPRHGAVLAYLDDEGIRLVDLARIAGRNKQTIAAILDELEKLGYVYRATDPADRRAKLIMPTQRGLEVMQLSDEILADIEAHYAEQLGQRRYAQFKRALRSMTTQGLVEKPSEPR